MLLHIKSAVLTIFKLGKIEANFTKFMTFEVFVKSFEKVYLVEIVHKNIWL